MASASDKKVAITVLEELLADKAFAAGPFNGALKQAIEKLGGPRAYTPPPKPVAEPKPKPKAKPAADKPADKPSDG